MSVADSCVCTTRSAGNKSGMLWSSCTVLSTSNRTMRIQAPLSLTDPPPGPSPAPGHPKSAQTTGTPTWWKVSPDTGVGYAPEQNRRTTRGQGDCLTPRTAMAVLCTAAAAVESISERLSRRCDARIGEGRIEQQWRPQLMALQIFTERFVNLPILSLAFWVAVSHQVASFAPTQRIFWPFPASRTGLMGSRASPASCRIADSAYPQHGVTPAADLHGGHVCHGTEVTDLACRVTTPRARRQKHSNSLA